MNQENPFSAPTTQNLETGDSTLRGMSTRAFKRLNNDSRTIFALGILWTLAGVAITGASLVNAGTLLFWVLLAFGLGYLVGAFACFLRPKWGRHFGLFFGGALGVLWIYSMVMGGNDGAMFIQGLAGVLGAVSFSRSKQLFGPDRISRKMLNEEVRRRKTLKYV